MPEQPQYEPIDLARESDFWLGAAHVIPSAREVVSGSQTETLEPRVMQVLVALAGRRGVVVSREELGARCWKGRVVGDDALNRCIVRLRQLADATGEFGLETIPRVGYRLNATRSIDRTSSDDALTIAPTARSDAPRARDTLPLLVSIVFLVSIVGYFAVRHWHQADAMLEDHTFAVLPFVALNEDIDSRHFALAVSDSVADVLTRAGQRVIPPAQAERYSRIDRAHFVDEAGARFVVDGEVRRDGPTLSVMVRIVDGRTGRNVMSNTFERNVADAAGLADVVAGYVGVRSWSYVPGAVRSDHAEVEDAGFREAEMLANGKSRAAYDLAVAMARKYPDDPQALLQYSSYSSFNYWALPKDEVATAMIAARGAAKRVTELVPTFGDGYADMAMLLPPQQWARREALLRHGLAVDPDTKFAGHLLAGMLAEVGRLRDAEQLERGEVGRDPFNLLKVRRQFELLSALGNRSDAAGVLAFGDRYVPGDADLVLSRFMASDFRGGAVEAAGMLANPAAAALIEPAERQPQIRNLLRALQSRQAANLDAAVKGCGTEWVSTQTTVACLVGMSAAGRLDDAFAYASVHYQDLRAADALLEDQQWLRRERSLFDTTVLFRPELAPMRADPRFSSLAERTRLLGYWRAGHAPDFCASERAPVCDAIGNP